jgi:glycosyltransferase involved in cell wall biosynthesis
LGKRFPKEALGLGIHTTALFGDNAASYGDSPSGKTRLLFELFKRGTYQKAIEKADRLVAYTPESFEAAGKMLGGKRAKMPDELKDFISLGFHPAEFYFREELRCQKRGELGFQEGDHVVITATRIRPEKELEKVILALSKSPKSVKWLLVGSAGDEYAERLSKKLAFALGESRFIMLPHQPRKELNGFYNAADVALFTAPAISVIEAMGTGLPVILPDVKSLSHLVRNPDSGQYVGDFDSFILPLPEAHDRSERAKNNRASLSWERQARMLLL